MTTQLPSKEQLLADIAHAEEKAATLCGSCADDHARLAYWLRALLAAYEQEPVAYRDRKESNGIRFAQNFDYGKMPDGAELFAHPAPSIPKVSFYRDGIVAAADWVDKQRESYDNEHGHHDPDTGMFEFGNDAQLEYSSTLTEVAEGIRALHPNATSAPSIPAAVPDEPTPEMQAAGAAAIRFDTTPVNKLFTANAVWRAMRAAMLQAEPDGRDYRAIVERISEIMHGSVTDVDLLTVTVLSMKQKFQTVDGWKLVPLIAFPSQWAAGQKAFDSAGINKVDAVYKAMVLASPEPGV